jgi:hypothetical protein
MKLLAKTAEERYQTAAGVARDLWCCLTQWEAHRRIDPFRLGAHDNPPNLVLKIRDNGSGIAKDRSSGEGLGFANIGHGQRILAPNLTSAAEQVAAPVSSFVYRSFHEVLTWLLRLLRISWDSELVALRCDYGIYRETLQPSSCLSEWLGRVQL